MPQPDELRSTVLDARPFSGPLEHLEAHWQRLRLMLMRYMRRHSDRLIQAGGSYTDLAVGSEEMSRGLGLLADPGEGQEWLDRHGVLGLPDIESELTRAAEELESRLLASHTANVRLPLD